MTRLTFGSSVPSMSGGTGTPLSFGMADGVDVDALPLSMGSPASQSSGGSRPASSPRLSYGSTVPSTGGGTTPVSYPQSTPRASTWGLGSFLQTFTMGTPASTNTATASPHAAAGYGVSHPNSNAPTANPHIRNGVETTPTAHTVNYDGGSDLMSSLRDLTANILGNMGSRGDGDIQPQPATYVPTQGGGGVNPLWIAGGAIAFGVIYYTVAS